MTQSSRRRFVKHAGLAGAVSILGSPGQSAEPAGDTSIDEYDPQNVKLARRVRGSLSDDDIRFLQQLGLQWVRVDLTREQANLGFLTELQTRFAGYGISIYSAVHPVQGSVKIGLGQDGRDEEIAEYQQFLQTLGRLKIPVAGYAFHPGNTYSTGRIQHCGYLSRLFDLDMFRQQIEKQ